MGYLDERATVELLTRARAGDDAAWYQIVSRHGERLRRLARLRLDPRLAARVAPEDIVQESLADAARSLATFLEQRDLVPFSTWLRQRLLDRVHRAHRTHLGTQARCVLRECRDPAGNEDEARTGWIDRLIDQGTTPSHGLTRDEARILVREALRELSEVHREILFFFEGSVLSETSYMLCSQAEQPLGGGANLPFSHPVA